MNANRRLDHPGPLQAVLLTLPLALLPACSLDAPREAATSAERSPSPVADSTGARGFGGAAGAAPAAAKPRRRAKAMKKGRGMKAELEESAEAPREMKLDDGIEGGGGDDQVATRSWFPETFLFEPALVTDASGSAQVSTAVPDRLTTWRVLALAHSRAGAQAGAVTSFLGTLPVYVDPVTPPFLYAGDRVELPLQLVNTTSEAKTSAITVKASGGDVVAGATHSALVDANASQILSATLVAKRPGTVRLEVRAAGVDAVVKDIPVRPSGRPVRQERGGTLAAPRTLTLTGHAQADKESAKVRVTVFPGALSLLRTELSAVAGRGGFAEDAYALLLAGQAPSLLEKLGDTADPKALRKLRILATQRVLRAARRPSLEQALLAAEAAAANANDPILERLSERLVAQVQQSQRPDGTFGGANGWTLQRLMVTTAEAARVALVSAADDPDADPERVSAAKRRAAAVRLRANFAFERHLGRVDDPYTAAAILNSGAVAGDLAKTLAKRVEDAVKTRDDGSRYLAVPKEVVRPDGRRPSVAGATAIAALALAGDSAPPWRADLGATLLASYNPGRGWGDGVTNLACLRAVLDLFSAPVPPGVKVTLTFDGAPVDSGVLDASRRSDTLVLAGPVPNAAGAHAYGLVAEPAVPGLGYSLTLSTWVPWEAEVVGGLELRVAAPSGLRVGRPSPVSVRATAPSRMAVTLTHALPAGMQVEGRSLDKLVSEGKIQRYEIEEGEVRMYVGPRANALLTLAYSVVPTLAGALSSGPISLSPTGDESRAVHVPPARWTIAR